MSALKLMIDNWRWAGVPFYLRTGKAMAARDTEIVIQFKPSRRCALFRNADESARFRPTSWSSSIQPNEGIVAALRRQEAGAGGAMPAGRRWTSAMPTTSSASHRTGYETLLYDCLTGDQTLFQRADKVERGWRVVQPILDANGPRTASPKSIRRDRKAPKALPR